MHNDPFHIERFVEAQNSVYKKVLQELNNGRKTSHWIWFVFPQLGTLGQSPMAKEYGISGFEEARAYLSHPLLLQRLNECCEALLMHAHKPIAQIMGHPDDLKLRSSMTLFYIVSAKRDGVFDEVLNAFYNGKKCAVTIASLIA